MFSPEIHELLARSGVTLSPQQADRLGAYAALIRRFQPVLSLVSVKDLASIETVHLADSLSLIPALEPVETGDRLVDIGSGAGFPAIPLKIALPGLKILLVERQTKRAGFLQKVIGALGLDGVTVVAGDYPRETGSYSAKWVTARAVEKPEKVVGAILDGLLPGMMWICQMGHPADVLGARFHVEPEVDDPGAYGMYRGRRFHVEPWEDAWTEQGLRRGRLWRVRLVP